MQQKEVYFIDYCVSNMMLGATSFI